VEIKPIQNVRELPGYALNAYVEKGKREDAIAAAVGKFTAKLKTEPKECYICAFRESWIVYLS